MSTPSLVSKKIRPASVPEKIVRATMNTIRNHQRSCSRLGSGGRVAAPGLAIRNSGIVVGMPMVPAGWEPLSSKACHWPSGG